MAIFIDCELLHHPRQTDFYHLSAELTRDECVIFKGYLLQNVKKMHNNAILHIGQWPARSVGRPLLCHS